MKAYGIPSELVDGNDALAVHRAAAVAADRARRGHGPSLIECSTYRWLEHCGPNDDVAQGFRPAEELEGWKARCPILRMRSLVTDEEDRSIRAAVMREIEDALAHARRAPWPEPSWKPAYYEV